jgi:hypothetical protein
MSDRDWLEKVITAASVHCENPNVDEKQIDMFLEYLFRVYGYTDFLKMKLQK